MKSKVVFQEGMAFDVELNGHHFTIDAAEKVGGKDKGPQPKGLVLSALGGCTAMDVVSIMRKKKVDFDRFEVEVLGETADDYPMEFVSIKVIYHVWGSDIDKKAVERSVELSETKYCGVSRTLEGSVKLENEIVFHEI